MSRRIAFGIALAIATIGAAVAAPSSGTLPPLRPHDASFASRVDNPWFPLLPGSRYVYRGVKHGRSSRDVVTVAPRTATVDGVPCAVVEDRLYIHGHLAERTTDWYTQDRQGNVCYFGEDTAELDARGKVTSTEGSWRAGVDGARPGIFMRAHPRVGQAGEQEYYKGHAQDRYRVIAVFGNVAGGSGPNALLTEETTPLEPGVVDHKLYVRGVGTVLEQTEKGGDERNELVSFTHG